MSMSAFSLKKKGELKSIRLQHFMMAEATARNREALMKMDFESYEFDDEHLIILLKNFMEAVEKEHRTVATAIESILNVI